MKKVGKDRVTFPTNPEVDSRKIERLRDEDSVLETSSSGDVSIEVTGAIPEFIGVPAGLQRFYVSPYLTENALNITGTGMASIASAIVPGLAVAQDFGNAFGFGSDRLIVKSVGNAAAIVSMATGNIVYVPVGASSTNYGWLTQNNCDFAITKLVNANFSPIVSLVRNGVANTVSLPAPSGMTVCYSTGISQDGQSICAFWGSANTSGSGTVRLAFYTPTGSLISAAPAFNVTSLSPRYVEISNGWVVYGSATNIFASRANSSAVFSSVSFLPGNSQYANTSRRVTTDDYFYIAYGSFDGSISYDVHAINLVSKTAVASKDALLRYNGGVLEGDIVTRFILGIDANRAVLGGTYVKQAGGAYPIYSAFDRTPQTVGSSVMSDSTYEQISGSSASTFVTWACYMSDGDVVYCIQYLEPVPGGGSVRFYLIKVAGP